jgi:hypothetical protein
MSEETMKVLQMLADGKITVEDAERLLNGLSAASAARGAAGPAAASGGGASGSETTGAAGFPAGGRRPRFLRVVVDGGSGDRVDVRVPLALLKAGIKMSALLPQHAREHVESSGLDLSDLSKLNPDELVEALRELTVDVEEKDGDSVRVFCE